MGAADCTEVVSGPQPKLALPEPGAVLGPQVQLFLSPPEPGAVSFSQVKLVLPELKAICTSFQGCSRTYLNLDVSLVQASESLRKSPDTKDNPFTIFQACLFVIYCFMLSS